MVLVLTIFNEGAYLTLKSIFHKALKYFSSKCDITLKSVPALSIKGKVTCSRKQQGSNPWHPQPTAPLDYGCLNVTYCSYWMAFSGKVMSFKWLSVLKDPTAFATVIFWMLHTIGYKKSTIPRIFSEEEVKVSSITTWLTKTNDLGPQSFIEELFICSRVKQTDCHIPDSVNTWAMACIRQYRFSLTKKAVYVQISH